MNCVFGLIGCQIEFEGDQAEFENHQFTIRASAGRLWRLASNCGSPEPTLAKVLPSQTEARGAQGSGGGSATAGIGTPPSTVGWTPPAVVELVHGRAISLLLFKVQWATASFLCVDGPSLLR